MNRFIPKEPEPLQAASAAYAAGDIDCALRWCRRAQAIAPTSPLALSTLGFVLHAAERYDEASRVFGSLTGLQPAESSHWMNLGTALRCDGRIEEALEAFANAAALGACSADFYYNLGLTHIERRDFESGRLVFAKALALAPDDAEVLYFYALCCHERLLTDEALAALENWEKLTGLDGDTLARFALLLLNLGVPERAEPAVRQAVSLGTCGVRPLLTLIQILERTNRLDEAVHLQAILLSHPQAHTLGKEQTLIRAQIAQRLSDHQTAVPLYEELIRECEAPHLKHHYLFPLAKSLDNLQQYDEALDVLRAAHSSQVQLLQMTFPALVARGVPAMDVAQFICDPEDVANWKDLTPPDLEHSPIFIVAFPRSGTTLLELALDSHTQLVSMDEQPFVQSALDDMISFGCSYPERLSGLSEDQLADLRSRYWRRVQRKVELTPGQRVIDKNPLNILRLPVIRRMFPHAPVILAVRHPCDVILSCFMQHFRTPEFALLCSTLQSLAIGLRRTFEFWYQQKQLLKPNSRELRYEALTAQYQTEIASLLEFLELPWDDAVMQPEKAARSKGFISTPSYAQVTEPVHNRAAGRWLSYERHMLSVLPIIQPLLQRWKYNHATFGNSNGYSSRQ